MSAPIASASVVALAKRGRWFPSQHDGSAMNAALVASSAARSTGVIPFLSRSPLSPAPPAKQRPHHVGVTVRARLVQRALPVDASCFHGSAPPSNGVGGGRAGPGERRAMQRRGARRPRARVRVRARRQQRAHALRVALARGVVQQACTRCRRRRRRPASRPASVKPWRGACRRRRAAPRTQARRMNSTSTRRWSWRRVDRVVGVPAATHRATTGGRGARVPRVAASSVA